MPVWPWPPNASCHRPHARTPARPDALLAANDDDAHEGALRTPSITTKALRKRREAALVGTLGGSQQRVVQRGQHHHLRAGAQPVSVRLSTYFPVLPGSTAALPRAVSTPRTRTPLRHTRLVRVMRLQQRRCQGPRAMVARATLSPAAAALSAHRWPRRAFHHCHAPAVLAARACGARARVATSVVHQAQAAGGLVRGAACEAGCSAPTPTGCE